MQFFRLRLVGLTLLIVASYAASISAVSLVMVAGAGRAAVQGAAMVHGTCAHGPHADCPMVQKGACPMSRHGHDATSRTTAHDGPCWCPGCGSHTPDVPAALLAFSTFALGLPPADRHLQIPAGDDWVVPPAPIATISLGHHPPSPPPRA